MPRTEPLEVLGKNQNWFVQATFHSEGLEQEKAWDHRSDWLVNDDAHVWTMVLEADGKVDAVAGVINDRGDESV